VTIDGISWNYLAVLLALGTALEAGGTFVENSRIKKQLHLPTVENSLMDGMSAKI
jgi:hypothetical protein